MSSNQTSNRPLRLVLKIAVFLLAAAVLVIVLWKALPWFLSLKDEGPRQEFQRWLDSFGVWGVFVMLGIQILQVVVAFLPGEPIELLSGILYGTFGGFFLCMAGLGIGTVIVFYTVKRLGRPFVERLFSVEKVSKLHFLQSEQKLEMLFFLLFFIPGTPKDILIYVAPLTRIPPRSFLLLSMLARIPSVISSNYAGSSLSEGNWIRTLIVFAITGVLGICGILFNKRFVDRMNRRRQNKESSGKKEE